MNERLKSLRGKILHLLRHNPEGLDRDGIVHVFYQYYKVKEIDEALQYLENKGYVVSQDIKLSPHKTYKFYRITARGIDILDLTEEDKGVIPAEEE